MKVYYSHPKILRDSIEALEDIALLEAFGHTVDNPYDKKYMDCWQELGIEFGKELIQNNDGFAFRPLGDGRITAGVVKELTWALELDKTIFEMPSINPFDSDTVESRAMSMEETVEFFKRLK